MLRDRLACGLRNEHIQKKLLSEADFTCKPALDIAVAMETAARDAKELQSKHSTATSVHKLYTKKKTFGHSGTPRKFILRKGSRVSGSGAMVTIIHKDVVTVTNGITLKNMSQPEEK